MVVAVTLDTGISDAGVVNLLSLLAGIWLRSASEEIGAESVCLKGLLSTFGAVDVLLPAEGST